MKLTKKLLLTLPIATLPLVTIVACSKASESKQEPKLPDVNTQLITAIETFKKLENEINSKFLVPKFHEYTNTPADENKKYIVEVNKLFKTILNEDLDVEVGEDEVPDPEMTSALDKSFNAVVTELAKTSTDAPKKAFADKFADSKASGTAFERLKNTLRDYAEQLGTGRYQLDNAQYNTLFAKLVAMLGKLKTKENIADSDTEAAIKQAFLAIEKYFVEPTELDHEESEEEKDHNHDSDLSKHDHSHAIFNMLNTTFHETEEFIGKYKTLATEMAKITNWSESEKKVLNDFIAQHKLLADQIEVSEPVIKDLLDNKIKPHYDLIKKELEKMADLNKLDKTTIFTSN